MSSREFTERRREVRVPARGGALFEGPDHGIHGRLLTISRSAIEMSSELGFAVLGMTGTVGATEVVLEGEPEPWRFRGRVAFVRAANHSLVIAFDDPSPALVDRIERWLAAAPDHADEAQHVRWTRDRDDERAEPGPRAQHEPWSG
jgi:hypothetical protein